MDLIDKFADMVINSGYDDIPADARQAAKRTVLDTLAVMIAGSSARGCWTVAEMAAEWGGKEESTIMIMGKRVPACNAVWANATMCRALDFDDVYTGPAGDHTSVGTVTTALAVSELLGKVSGKDVIAAIALGAELVLAIRRVSQVKIGAYPWTVSGTAAFTSAAVAAKLLKLDKSQFINALGLALCQISGTLQSVQDGTLAVRVHHGMMVRGGFLAAQMAARGITGPHNVLEGRYGFYPVYFQNQYDRKALLEYLAKGFQSLICDISVKNYPCCVLNHPAIEGSVRLAREHDINPAQVQEIRVYTNQQAYDVCGYPEDRKKKPQNIVDAQFSIPYSAAAALVHRDVFIDAYQEKGIQEPEVLELAAKVKVIVHPELNAGVQTLVTNRVEVQMKGGKVHQTEVKYVKGHPENPMSFDDCVIKFRRCLAYSARPLPERGVNQALDMLKDLEHVDNVGLIPGLLVSKS